MEASPTPLPIRALVAGHTGASGKALLSLLLASPFVESVVTLGRRELPAGSVTSAKLRQVVVPDMSALATQDRSVAAGCNAAFCCLGTTRADAGSADAFRAVDLHMVREFAKLARDAGVSFIALISSDRASSSSWFLYPKTKGEAEEAVMALGFPRLAILRPGMLARGNDSRTWEALAGKIFTGMDLVKMGEAMIEAALGQEEALHVYANNKEIIDEAAKLAKRSAAPQ